MCCRGCNAVSKRGGCNTVFQPYPAILLELILPRQVQETGDRAPGSPDLCSGELQAEHIYLLELRQHGKTLEPVLGYIPPLTAGGADGRNMVQAQQLPIIAPFPSTGDPTAVAANSGIGSGTASAVPLPAASGSTNYPNHLLPDPVIYSLSFDPDYGAYSPFGEHFLSPSGRRGPGALG
ncbi:uncharacterized protein PHACADRAFT_257380 [Phanerochaete carnosa HHB-10118-sp]|uniref:Uncharacterized protein n=1 Tax=Phanerochaete carnosa (strain HHB-10118-sp) TaxID=650164 RepID=K5W4M8_PHACS|nr:uncharacterized protein PHACADRAFT_257380 [Phanerochaete carnosa HHB-10118-sp]EKM53894.1 hypothetical protein PHACADRAFT_257380 [Phanerochaete carnosa HHB-10118-sp]